MPIKITLAENSLQRAAAHNLVRETYLKNFELDVNEIHHLHPEEFKSDVLTAYSSDDKNLNEVLGTMSIIYPNENGLFPSETLFGFDLSKFGLAQKKYVEVGRFATAPYAKQNSGVVISLFLGALYLFQKEEINGWTGTVKNDVFDFLKRINLPMENINQYPKLSDNDPLKSYVGDYSSLHPFLVPVEKTIETFKRFNSYLESSRIKIDFPEN